MNRVLCLLRGGHKPMRTSISMTRIFCRHCGRELQYVTPQPPSPRDEVPTTIKPTRYPTPRAFGRLAPPSFGTSDQYASPEEQLQAEQLQA
jgi:hypothetical protein